MNRWVLPIDIPTNYFASLKIFTFQRKCRNEAQA